MIQIIGAVAFGMVAVLTLLIGLGLPLGEFTMGGKHKVLPKNMRVFSFVSLVVQLFAIMVILQAGGIFPILIAPRILRYIVLFFAIYLSMNTVMNISSKSKKERYLATPLSTIAAICFWLTWIHIK